MSYPNTIEECHSTISELYSVIWLLVYGGPEHRATISEVDRIKLDPNGATFTIWEELQSSDLVIVAHRKE